MSIDPHDPPIADLPTLELRYGMEPRLIVQAMARALEKKESPVASWEFQGVCIWWLPFADAWFCKHLRSEYEVTQEELTEALRQYETNMSQSTLSKWERRGGIPTYLVPKLRHICEEIVAQRLKEDAA